MTPKERAQACKPDKTKVVEVLRPVYGIPPAGRRWHIAHSTTMRSWGIKQCTIDSCMYIKRDGDEWILIITFVDDVSFFGTDKMCKWFVKQHEDFGYKMKYDPEQKGFLGMKVIQTKGEIHLRQKSLIEVILKKFEVYTKEKYPKATVFPVGEKLEEATSSRQVECTTARPNKLQGGFWASDCP